MEKVIITLPNNMQAEVYDNAIIHKPELYQGFGLSLHDCAYISWLRKKISDGKFKWEKYVGKKSYFRREIQTRPLFASYGQIGYIVSIPILDGDSPMLQLEYDWEMNKFNLHE